MARGPRATITPRRCPRVHLHRVVPSVPSRWSGCPLHPWKSYREQGHTPCGPLAACLRLRGRLTRAMTDSHRAALLTRLSSHGASTRHQPFAAPRSRLAIRPLAAKRSPASISISIASRVDAAGSRKRRGGLPSSGQRRLKRPRSMARGHRDYPHRRASSRVHCICPAPVESGISVGMG